MGEPRFAALHLCDFDRVLPDACNCGRMVLFAGPECDKCKDAEQAILEAASQLQQPILAQVWCLVLSIILQSYWLWQ